MKIVELESETDIENNNQDQENQMETPSTKSLLLSDPWKPYQQPRAIVKGQTVVINN